MSSGPPREIDFVLPAGAWVPLEKIFFPWPWGNNRHIRVPVGAPLIQTRFFFSVPPFYYEGSASPGFNAIWLPIGYTEVHARSPVELAIRYVLG